MQIFGSIVQLQSLSYSMQVGTIVTEKAKAEEIDIHPRPFFVCNPAQGLNAGTYRIYNLRGTWQL